MMTAFYREGDAISQVFVRPSQPLVDNPVWIDLHNPSYDEEKRLKQLLGISIPNREEIWRNHITNHMYDRDGVFYMNAAVIHKVTSAQAKTSAITFIISDQCLVTIRYIYPTSFEHFQQRVTHHPESYPTSNHLLCGLLEEMVARAAFHLESLDEGLDEIGYRIFDDHAFENKQGNPSLILRKILQKLGSLNALNSKIYESLNALLRLISYFRDEITGDHPALGRRLDVLSHETKTLADQSSFLNNKINFSMDASLGMINVEQNLISKIFSIAAVFFLPPTLISSLYGMNFKYMPELDWPLGYPMAVGFMITAAAATWWFFKNKGWL
jgi:magnesium transporter